MSWAYCDGYYRLWVDNQVWIVVVYFKRGVYYILNFGYIILLNILYLVINGWFCVVKVKSIVGMVVVFIIQEIGVCQNFFYFILNIVGVY